MNIAIIGGGIGGLMSALYLSQDGYQVTIYEKEEKLGGRLKYVEKNGFKIDEGPTIVLLPEMLQQLLEEAGIDRSCYELLLCDPLYSIHYTDGSAYTKYKDIDRQVAELKRQFPDDMNGFLRFMDEGRERLAIGQSAFLQKSFSDSKSFWTNKNIKALMKLKPYQSIQKLMKSYFQDEKLQIAYSLQTLYVGGNPFHTPAMYSLISFSEHEHGVYYLKGGYAKLVQLLEEELKSRNVTVKLGQKVTNMKTIDNKITSLEVNGKWMKHDAFIFNGDFPSLQKVFKKAPKRSYVPSSSCVLLYFGLDSIYKNVNVHQFLLGKSFSNHMNEVFESKVVPSDPSIYTFHPSIMDDTLAPKGKGVLYTLIPVPANVSIDWSQQQNWIDRIIDRLEKQAFPQLRKRIEWMQVRTPNDAEHFGLFQGGNFGIAPTLFQSGVFRPQVKPTKFENLYAVGASIHPGGGIPIVMQGAKLLHEQMTKDTTNNEVKNHA